MPSNDRLNREVTRISQLIKRTPFEKWFPLERSFQNLSFATGIYAIRKREKVLYVGRANAFRTRFQGGHQALTRMLVDGISPIDIRILTIPLTARYADNLKQIEKGIIYVLQPEYNVLIPNFKEATDMQLREPTTGHLKDILNYLPDSVVDAVEDHADTYGLTDTQVIELAIANLLDLNTTSLKDLQSLETLANLKERVAILEIQLEAAKAQGFQVPELPE
jgi:hypothetical protein